MKKRKLYFSLIDHLFKKQYTIISGARQTGKTTLLHQIEQYLIEKKRKTYFFNLEEMDILSDFNVNPENIFNYIKTPLAEKIFVLIDEVQYLDNPSNFLKLLYDKFCDSIKIIATGSSAFYIDKKFKDSLVGRKRLFELYTLDFEEFIQFKTADDSLLEELSEIRKSDSYISLKRNKLISLLNEYLIYGGYPAVVLADNDDEKLQLLKDILHSYLKKDIYEARIKNETKFYNLLTLLAHQNANLLNVHELSNTLKLSIPAVENYLYILRKSFHIQLIRPFYSNVRKEITKMPKLFFNDMGFRNMVINLFSPVPNRPDRGVLTENYVFIRLQQLYGSDKLYYWRTSEGNEVDFVVKQSLINGRAVEVKYNMASLKISKYNKFIQNYPDFPLQFRAYVAESNNTSILGL